MSIDFTHDFEDFEERGVKSYKIILLLNITIVKFFNL